MTIRVLIAEDSATVRYHLARLIDEQAGMCVVGQAQDGAEALRLVAALEPDVVSMDISMPQMDGLEATRQIMAQHPTPVVIVSSLVDKDIQMSFRALEAGAVAVVEKPPARQSPSFPQKQQRLLTTLSAMATAQPKTGAPIKRAISLIRDTYPPEVIAIGASAGGPSALSHLLAALPGDLPVPVVVVQHIPDEFLPGLARWLDQVTPLHVQMASQQLVLKPGVVNLSPGTAHIQVVRRGPSLVANLVPERGENRYQPSINVLFRSIAATCQERAVGLVLTGMGDDGAAGLLAMHQAGAHTFAQDEASSTVFGMPGAAIAHGAAEHVLPLAQLPGAILKLIGAR